MTTSFSVGGAEGYMTASKYPDDGLGEIFLKMSKQGSTLAGVMDAFSIAISIGLQYGVPLETYVKKFVNMRFDPAGMTDDPDVRMAQSMMDYIFRRLALDHLPYESRSALGIYSAEERSSLPRDRFVRGQHTGSVGGSRAGDARAVSADDRGAKLKPRRRWRGNGCRRDCASCSEGERSALVDGVAGGHARHGVRCAAVPHLRHEDASSRFLLRLRRVRCHQRLQLAADGWSGAQSASLRFRARHAEVSVRNLKQVTPDCSGDHAAIGGVW